tara:strand:+ start:3902 stop:4378 length:477 start_codon:yes stop_codon:yes gene_type:complete
MKLLLILLFTQSLFAAVLKNEVGGLKRKAFSLKEACEKFGLKDNLLVEAVGSTKLDCMGREVEVAAFCEKIESNDALLRGFVSKSKSQVYCEYGTSVSLSLSCDKDHYHYCQKAETGCKQLRSIFAKKLDLMHSSLTGTPKVLNCHYSIPDPLLPKDL